MNSCEIGVFVVKAGMSEDALSSGWAALSVQGFIVQFVNTQYMYILQYIAYILSNDYIFNRGIF